MIYAHIDHLELLDGKVEANQSYFGDKRKGKLDRNASGKVPVFGLLKCNRQVFTVVITDTKESTSMPIVR